MFFPVTAREVGGKSDKSAHEFVRVKSGKGTRGQTRDKQTLTKGVARMEYERLKRRRAQSRHQIQPMETRVRRLEKLHEHETKKQVVEMNKRLDETKKQVVEMKGRLQEMKKQVVEMKERAELGESCEDSPPRFASSVSDFDAEEDETRHPGLKSCDQVSVTEYFAHVSGNPPISEALARVGLAKFEPLLTRLDVATLSDVRFVEDDDLLAGDFSAPARRKFAAFKALCKAREETGGGNGTARSGAGAGAGESEELEKLKLELEELEDQEMEIEMELNELVNQKMEIEMELDGLEDQEMEQKLEELQEQASDQLDELDKMDKLEAELKLKIDKLKLEDLELELKLDELEKRKQAGDAITLGTIIETFLSHTERIL